MNQATSLTQTSGQARDAVGEMAQEQVLHDRMSAIDRKLLVLSGKGGVGKSTVAVNLAATLAQRGWRVGLLDVDVHGPSVPTLLQVEDPQVHGDNNNMVPITVADQFRVISVGFLTPTAQDPIIWRGPKKFHVIRQFFRNVTWGAVDYLVIDCPPGTGDEPLAVAQLVGADAEAVVVTMPQEVAISDVRRCVNFCHSTQTPVAGVIENMSGFVCPHCGQRSDLFKQGGGQRLARETELPLLGTIPIDPAVVQSGDAGQPLLARDHPDSPAADAFRQIVDNMTTGKGNARVNR
jgi:Mrp family chromosome partitioning ATPase